MIRHLTRCALAAVGGAARTAAAAATPHMAGRVFPGPLRPAAFSATSLLLGARRAAALTMPPSAGTIAAMATAAASQLGPAKLGILAWVAVDFGIQWAGWAVSALLKTEKFYDMLGTSTFLLLAVGSVATCGTPHVRKYVASAMVAAWAVRLGSYLVMRVMKVGHDSRFDEVKHQPLKFWVYWTLQGVWVAITLAPLLLLNCATAGGPVRLLWTDVLGGGLWGAGFAIEAVADAQKWVWRADPANKGKFIDSGLWSLARFPNYGGEMMLWWGMFILCASGLQGPQLACAASPAFVMFLLRYMSGVPLQEEQAQARWGQDPAYQAYRARTNLLFPVPRWGSSSPDPKAI